MRESHGDALCGSETVFAIENHAVAAIEQNHGGAGAVVFALVDHQVGVSNLDGDFHAVAADGVEERFAYVQIQRVAEFVLSRTAAGFYPGAQIPRLLSPPPSPPTRAS